MKKVRLGQWNMDAFTAIRTDPAVRSLVDEQAEKITRRANELASIGHYGWSGRIRRSNRYGAIVYTDNFQARVDNLRHNTLLKAVDS